MRAVLVLLVALMACGCSDRPSRPDAPGEPGKTPGDSDGGAAVSLVKAEVGPVEWEEPPPKPLPKYLKVWVKTKADRKIEFVSWAMTMKPTQAYVADQAGNKYPVYRAGRYPGNSEYTGTDGSLLLSPGESVTALLLFEPPPADAAQLTLHLPGPNVQSKNDFTLPIKKWK